MPLRRVNDLKESWSEHNKTNDETRDFHYLYMKAVNHPIRREILVIVNEKISISEKELFNELKGKDILNDINTLKYHLDYLEKGYCIEKIKDINSKNAVYKITQEGNVVDYL